MRHPVAVLVAITGLLVAAAVSRPLFTHRVRRETSFASVGFERLLRAAQEPQNWLTYSGGYAGWRYSELTQVTPANVNHLQLQWSLRSRSNEKHQATPLAVDGTIYTIQEVNDVVALDAATGAERWRFPYRPHPSARNCCGQLSRGLAILDQRVFLATLDAHMIALDARTGTVLWNSPIADPAAGFTFTHAPLVIKDKVIQGTAGGDFGIRGFIAAFDVSTGKEIWRFQTVPGPGESGHETWSGESWKHGGGPVWLTGSYDPETNLTFWGVGNPGPDWDGSSRLGDNLYTCSVVALDADTGRLKWHYQSSPHNEFDWDAAQIPVLADLSWQARPRKVMLWANRNGIFYVLDRITGEFLLGRPFVNVTWAVGFDVKGRPLLAPGAVPSETGTRISPDDVGATNWYSPSYSPRTGLFYVPARENSSAVFTRGTSPPVYRQGDRFNGIEPTGRLNDAGVYSTIRALDPSTGETKWDYRLTASAIRAGVLTTASDLLFSGNHEGDLYALDARNGTRLWQTPLGAPITAGPMTYAIAGRQYVSIQAGATLVAFALP